MGPMRPMTIVHARGHTNKVFLALSLLIAISAYAGGSEPMSIPADFPQFRVPGHEKEMKTLRELFWLHYPGAGPKSTLWDPWLPMPSLWPAVETKNYMEWFRKEWRESLGNRPIDSEGYVSVLQHAS